MSAIMLLTCFTFASAEFIAERSGGDPLGCPYKHVEFVNHAMNSSAFHTWEYVCPQTPEYKVSVVGQFAHCWVDKGVLTNNATVLSSPCCNVRSFTKHLPLCATTAKKYQSHLTCHDFDCTPGTKLEGAKSMYIGISDVKHCPKCGGHRHRYVPYGLCCRKPLSMCESGDHRQPEECKCGNLFPYARCSSFQICKPKGNGKCETGEFKEYVQAVNGGTAKAVNGAACANGYGYVINTQEGTCRCDDTNCNKNTYCNTSASTKCSATPRSTMSAYVIAGIVVGALVLVALLAGSFIWCFTRKATGAAAATSQEQQLEEI
eukprot:GEMP01031056.1.p1 GENE.GEMP01031056.1~~GEMP01031056.1.p1  ORF type:complete len:318 (+),score=40.50 GEMP01031056.1:68-1021(+)